MLLWIKCFHVLFVIAWMAGLFYLPRIFVHYVEGRAAGEDVRRLLIMAQRLARFMDVMAMIAMALGLWMMLGFGDTGRWLMAKLAFVLLLLLYHGVLHMLLGRARRGAALPGGVLLRVLNEAALLIVIPILIFAVVKPF
ncbi:MAG: CopD family protein [Steroidobacteraceae bacterium]